MGKTSIEWTATRNSDGSVTPGFSFNPWVGCRKVSPACDHCYAESWAKRTGSPELWQGDRRRTSAENWRKPLAWNAACKARGTRARVFCASLADVFDNLVSTHWRWDLFALIRKTPHLDWLLLTKRIGNARAMLNSAAASALDDLGAFRYGGQAVGMGGYKCNGDYRMPPRIDWVICGGESGSGARPMHIDWARSLRDHCATSDTAFHFKQFGEWGPARDDARANAAAHLWVDGYTAWRVGKKLAGRELDGRTWDESPRWVKP